QTELLGLGLQEDGRLVAAGFQGKPADARFVVARFLKDGQLDPSFGRAAGTPGFVLPGFVGLQTIAYSVAFQSDGKIVAEGVVDTGAGNQFALARLKKDGRLDSSFGTSGLVTTPILASALANAVGIDDVGRIVAAGTAEDISSLNIAMARYTKKGLLDRSFG